MNAITSLKHLLTPLALIFAIAAGAPAQAETITLNCSVGTQIVHYSPGITNTPKPTTFTSTAQLTACVGVPLGISNAQINASGFGNIGCESSDADVTLDILWGDQTTSTAEVVNVITQRPTGQIIVVSEAEIVSGRFVGATLTRTLTLLQTDLAGCSTPEGVTSAAGPVTMTVTSLL